MSRIVCWLFVTTFIAQTSLAAEECRGLWIDSGTPLSNLSEEALLAEAKKHYAVEVIQVAKPGEPFSRIILVGGKSTSGMVLNALLVRYPIRFVGYVPTVPFPWKFLSIRQRWLEGFEPETQMEKKVFKALNRLQRTSSAVAQALVRTVRAPRGSMSEEQVHVLNSVSFQGIIKNKRKLSWVFLGISISLAGLTGFQLGVAEEEKNAFEMAYVLIIPPILTALFGYVGLKFRDVEDHQFESALQTLVKRTQSFSSQLYIEELCSSEAGLGKPSLPGAPDLLVIVDNKDIVDYLAKELKTYKRAVLKVVK